MLVPSSSWTLEIRDIANKILTKSLGAGSSHDLDKDGTTIFFRAGVLAFLENLRTNRLNDCAIMIQKNLKAKSYRRKYLEARNAILLIQSIARGYLARKHAQETRKVPTEISLVLLRPSDRLTGLAYVFYFEAPCCTLSRRGR
jgi:myosin-5